MRVARVLILLAVLVPATGCGAGESKPRPTTTTTAGDGISAYADLQRYGRELQEGCSQAGYGMSAWAAAVQDEVGPALRRGDTAGGIARLRRELVLAVRRLRRGMRLMAAVEAPDRFRALGRALTERRATTEAAATRVIAEIGDASPRDVVRIARAFDPDGVGFARLRVPAPVGRVAPSCPSLFDGPLSPPPSATPS